MYLPTKINIKWLKSVSKHLCHLVLKVVNAKIRNICNCQPASASQCHSIQPIKENRPASHQQLARAASAVQRFVLFFCFSVNFTKFCIKITIKCGLLMKLYKQFQLDVIRDVSAAVPMKEFHLIHIKKREYERNVSSVYLVSDLN